MAISTRATKTASMGTLMQRFMKAIRDPYDAEKNPDGIINLGTSEHYLMHDDLVEYMNKHIHVTGNDLLYGTGAATGSFPLREAMVALLKRHFHPHSSWDVSLDDVMFSNGVTSVNEMVAFCLGDEGDGLLLGRGIYGAFENDFGARVGLKTIYVSAKTKEGKEVDPFGLEMVQCYEDAVLEAEKRGVKVKALLIASPHNPLGKCYPPSTLAALAQLCQKYTIHLLSDEIYALSIFKNPAFPDATPFCSAMSLDLPSLGVNPDLIHVLYGMSKDFAASGIRLGCLITRSPSLKMAYNSISMFHWPSSLSCTISATLLNDTDYLEKTYLPTSRARIASAYALTTSLLDAAGIRYHTGQNAGFFLWVDFSPFLPALASLPDIAALSLEEKEQDDLLATEDWRTGRIDRHRETELAGRMLEKGKVYIATGEEFHSETEGWMRIIFTVPEPLLREGLRRIIAICRGEM